MALDKELDSGYGRVDTDALASADSRAAAMGKGEEELFEKKQSKEEKKAAAKAAREAKKKLKEESGGGKNGSEDNDNDEDDNEAGDEKKSSDTKPSKMRSVKSEGNMKNKASLRSVQSDGNLLDAAAAKLALEDALNSHTELSAEEKHDAAMEWLSAQQIAVTYTAKKGRLHANARDINVSGVTVNFHGKPLVEDTELVINYGNRYGFIGPNGSGKVRNLFCLCWFVCYRETCFFVVVDIVVVVELL